MPRPLEGYSKGDVDRAGKILAHDIREDEVSDDIARAFEIANSWISSHAYPIAMTLNRARKVVREAGIDARPVGRDKRLLSVRKKLTGRKLTGIQDLGGVRIVVGTIEDLDRVTELYRRGCGEFEIWREDDYISKPRASGYRSRHFVLRMPPFRNTDRLSHRGQRVELQLRTQLQHEWSTAVEAAGLIMGVSLKNGEGPQDWLRLMALMGEAYRLHEEHGTSVGEATRSEISSLADRLDASAVLDGRYLSQIDNPRASYVILDRDPVSGETALRSYSRYSDARRALDKAKDHGLSDNAVLLQADRETSFTASYPNYFGDTVEFRKSLGRVISGEALKPIQKQRRMVVTKNLPSGTKRYTATEATEIGTEVSGIPRRLDPDAKEQARIDRETYFRRNGYIVD